MKQLILSLILVICAQSVFASNIISVTPLTDRILLVHFDDGEVIYPNELIVDRLNVEAAQLEESYTLTSSDDPDYQSGVSPTVVYRKTKGTEFVKDVPWNTEKWAFDPTGKPWAAEHWLYLELETPLQPGASYTLQTGALAANGSEWPFTFEVKNLRSEAVHTNTIGYLPDAPKFGYVYHWMGDGGGLDLSAYEGNSFWVYNTDNLEDPVKTGTLQPRKLATNAETGRTGDTPFRNFLGAAVYDCDFSDLTTTGDYVLVVEGIGRSYPFSVGPEALKDAAYTFGRGLYYQRSGIRLAPPYTDGDYVRPVTQNPMLTSDDGTDFSDLLLYSDFPFTSWTAEGGGDAQDAIKAAAVGNTLEVAGWYHDAGDWDAYHTHQKIPAQLMLTYEYAPERFSDDELNIPESGNGIPDIVDEASWLVKFNYRLRKELINKGYSDGGVGGARICPDVYNEEDGNAQENKPSWQDHRRYVVTQADAFMTYYYAGQAAQLAYILKSLGKDPTAFPVEMLDAVALEDMTYDEVDWIAEAEAAYAWASDPNNQPESADNYQDSLAVYRLYAAVNLFRLTGNPAYQEAARPVLENLMDNVQLSEVAKLGLYSYMAANHAQTDRLLQRNLENTVAQMANWTALNAADRRALRWGGIWDMPMLIGQGTTPWMFETIMACELLGDDVYRNVIHQTVDYFLGGNAMHTTWASGVGPRPVESGFHLDSRYNNDWVVYPGHIPYGPWSLAFGYDPVTYVIDGVEMQGGKGPWNKDWHNFSMYPLVEEWPGHSRYCFNIHAPTSSENTIHQNTVFAHLAYGYASSQHYKNAEMPNPVGHITLSKDTITLDTIGDLDTLLAVLDIPDASFGQLRWSSSEPRIAHVDGAGYVTGVTAGETVVTCATLDGSVQAQCIVICDWHEAPVEGIEIELDTLEMIEGQERGLNIDFTPADAPNQFVDWVISDPGVAGLDTETQVFTALAPGETWAVATSMNGGQVDSLFIRVLEATDFVIVDFDTVIPITDGLSPDSAQVYTPQGMADIAAPNPLPGLANPSSTVAAYHRPEGNWRLIGFALPTDSLQELSRYAELQFQYFGQVINDFMIQINTTSGNTIEFNEPVAGEDCWQLATVPLSSADTVATINVFVNPQEAESFVSYFDEVKLAGQAAVYRTGLSLSSSYVEMAAGDTVFLSAFAEDIPFTFVSENPAIVTVDQSGQLVGFAEGEAMVKAIPLYGEAALCQVKVEGGCPPPAPAISTTIIDVEDYPLDWSQGYGVFAWNTDQAGKVANPVPDVQNASGYVIEWARNGTPWGGVGIGIPQVSTDGFDLLEFQLHPTAEVDEIRMEVSGPNGVIGEQTLNQLGLPANQWSEVNFDLEAMEAKGVVISQVIVQVGGSSTAAFTVYLDNFQLRTQGLSLEGLTLTPDELAIPIGTTAQLDPLFTPENPADSCLEWSSSAPQIASVDEEGTVAAHTPGFATVTAKARDGGFTASVDVHALNTDATLSNLLLDGVPVVDFDPNQLAYTVEYAPADTVMLPTLEAPPNDPNAVVDVAGPTGFNTSGSATVTAEDGQTQLTYEVFLSVMTGTAEAEVVPIEVFPNPASRQIRFSTTSRISTAEVYGANGQLVSQPAVLEGNQGSIRLEGLPDGTYWLKVGLADGRKGLQTFTKVR